MLKLKGKYLYTSTFWSGLRRSIDVRYKKDCTFYINKHIKCLELFRHNLDLIVFIISHNPNEPPEFTNFLEKIPNKIQNTPVEIFRRKTNIGMSYGGLNDIFLKYRNNYKYYFFVEDDYAFLQNNFDKICDDFFKDNPKCAYVCSEARPVLNLPHHAAMSNGCITSESMEKLYYINGKTIYPFPKGNYVHNYNEVQRYGQLGISRGIIKCGFEIKDFRENYRSGFRFGNDMSIKWIYKKNKKVIIGPL